MMQWHLISAWSTTPGAHPRRPDPYVLWAELSNWRDLGGRSKTEPVPLIVELVPGVKLKDIRQALKGVLGDPPAAAYPDGCRHFTLRLTQAQIELLACSGELMRWIERFDICAPVKQRVRVSDDTRPVEVMALEGKVMLGIVDAGFPFAHPALAFDDKQNNGKGASRIACWWAMDAQGPFARATRTDITVGSPSMGYGHELRHDGKGLDKWLEARRHLDESTLYELADYRRLRRRATHGSHVATLLLGARPLRSRLALTEDRFAPDPDRPPTWELAEDVASDPQRSDVALVELPQEGINDSSGGWLGAHMLDAVTWIAAVGRKAKRRIVTMSYGSTVGPHDGSSTFETALEEVLGGDRDLHIVIAAGNSFGSRLHATLDADADSLRWRIPPASRTPAFMQLWCPAATGAQAAVTIAPPGQPPQCVRRGEVHILRQDGGEPAAVVAFLSNHSRGCTPMVLIALAPTAPTWQGHGVEQRPLAPAGDWRITLCGEFNGQVQVYVARNDRDLGARVSGRSSWIADDKDEPSRHLRGCRDDPGCRSDEIDEETQREGSVIRRRGTLNGIASVAHDRLHVATGYQLRNSDHTGYSAAGSARVRGPSAALVTDESAAVRGVRASGVRGASTARLVGTSVAAPQLARLLAEDSPPQHSPNPPRPPATPGNPQDREELFGPGGDDSKLPSTPVGLPA